MGDTLPALGATSRPPSGAKSSAAIRFSGNGPPTVSAHPLPSAQAGGGAALFADGSAQIVRQTPTRMRV